MKRKVYLSDSSYDSSDCESEFMAKSGLKIDTSVVKFVQEVDT